MADVKLGSVDCDLLGAGKHGSLEKPMARSAEAAHRVRCVADGRTPNSSGQDPLRDIEIAEEVLKHGLGVD